MFIHQIVAISITETNYQNDDYIFAVHKKDQLYSMSIDNRDKLNQLLKYWSTGALEFFSSWLNRNEYSNQLMQTYRKSGWFSSLAKGFT